MIYNRNSFNSTFNCFTTLSENEKKAGWKWTQKHATPHEFLTCYISQRINFRVLGKRWFKTLSKEAEKSKTVT